MFKYFQLLILGLVLTLGWPLASWASQPVDVYLFWAEGCPHCAAEKVYLADLMEQPAYQEAINLRLYEISQPGTTQALKLFSEKLNFSPNHVPITIVGDQSFIGFSEETIGLQIKQAIDQVLAQQNNSEQPDTPQPSQTLNVPLWGQLDLAQASLPLITIIIGLLDGFNPCAMWTLIFLISLLLGIENKTRMWVLGAAFIVTSAVVYFIFMAAWLNAIIFLGLVLWVRILIGLFALGGGGWSVKRFWTEKDSGCEINESDQRRQTLARLKTAVYNKKFVLALAGIIALAFTVNLVEMVCSAGLPAIYTQVLVMNNLPTWQYYGYLLLYIFFFMLDDLLVFIVAMTTLRLTGLSTKYSRWSNLAGGLLMIIIGLLLIFKHEWLMFG